MSDLLENPKLHQYPPIGSLWRENDPRSWGLKRRVLAHDFDRGKVQLDGPVKTWAKAERFNGKRGGYSRVNEQGEPYTA